MWRSLSLLGLCGGLCSGCALPSTSEPSQLPSPAASARGSSTFTLRTNPPPIAPLFAPVAPIRSLAKTPPATQTPKSVSSESSVDLVPEQELEAQLLTAPETLGSLSIGNPNAGALFNGIQLTETDYFEPVETASAWGTDETLAYLHAAARKVHAAFPDSPRLKVGDISRQRGGHLSPHRSHQSGRDVDVGYFYKKAEPWYRRATPANLDLPRTWAFVRALVTETDVEMIFIDHTLSAAIRRYAETLGEDRSWLRRIFSKSPAEGAIVRHASGHATHMHVRFHNPQAQRRARQAYPLLVKHELVDKVEVYRYHRAKRGETLGKLAKRYGTTAQAIQRANGLRSHLIQAKKSYKIPTTTALWYTTTTSEVPPRRLPPSE